MALALCTSGVFAQTTPPAATELTSKRGATMLPETGDWALGIDASPVLTYVGSFLGNAANNAPTWGYVTGTNLSITGKYFKDEKTAYRVMLRLGFGGNTQNAYSKQDGQALPDVTVKDSKSVSQRNIILGGGMEMRRGKTRLQGFYGAMLMFGILGSDTTYAYGNAFSTTNQVPTRTNFGTNQAGATWTKDNAAGSAFMIGVRGFIGAEYFILPKLSVGAEFGWGFGFSNQGDGSRSTEYWDAAKNAVATTTMKTGGTSSWGIDNDINSGMMMSTGQLMITMHF